MLDKVTDAENAATIGTLAVGSELSNTLVSESDGDDWFYEAARVLLGKDAGQLLHYITGYPLSSCYAYVAKNPDKRRPVPEHLLRKLFASNQGEAWHRAFMAACRTSWWSQYELALKVKRAIAEVEKDGSSNETKPRTRAAC